jgi:hypothetical protein
MRIAPFDAALHVRQGFDCGHQTLNEYLQRYAKQGQRAGVVRIYVALDQDYRILGYYTLSAASLSRDSLPENEARRLPRYPVPAVLIGRLATDISARTMGLRIGTTLLIHALAQALQASETIGIQSVIVDSKPEAVGFYRQFGFLPLQQENGLRLFLPIRTIRKLALTHHE